MQYDDLEKYIRANRDDFDHELPPSNLWEKISGEAQRKSVPSFSFRGFFKMAATIAVLLACSFMFGNNFILNNLEESRINRRLPADFKEIELYYIHQISSLQERLNDMGAEPNINEDLLVIDQTVQNLKKELGSAISGTEPEILNNIIKSYQMKLQIMKRVFERSNEKNALSNNVSNNGPAL